MRVLLTALALCAVMATQALAQMGSVKGTVTDRETKQNLRGATVVLVSLGGATASDRTLGAYVGADGAYFIDDVPAGEWRVQVTFVGYKQSTRKVTVSESETVQADFALTFDPKKLDEVIVTGVASRHPKTESEIAVSRIDAGQLQEANVYTDVTQLMQGKAAGVNIQQGSGNVGGGMRFTIRGGGGLNGNGIPLIFVDGARIFAGEVAQTGVGGQSYSALANLNPADIEDIEILKGPAGAALYGTAGSNGVILITTKRGSRTQDRINVTAQAIVGYNDNPFTFDSTRFASAANLNNDVFRRGPIQEYNVGINGSSGGLGYLISYGRRNEQGIVNMNELMREDVRANFDFSPTNEVTVSLNGSYSTADITRPQGDNNIFSEYAVKYLVDPNWLGTSYIFGVDSLAMSRIENRLNTERFTASAQLNYRPDWAPGLTFRGVVGYDGNVYTEESYQPPGFFYTGIGFDGNRTTGTQSINRLNYDVSASYATTFGTDITSTTRLGLQSFDTRSNSALIDMQGFASPKIRAQQSAATFLSTADGVGQSREAGLYLQEELVFSETYFVSVGGRLDYTTLLGATATQQFFPRASGMVRLDKFDFMPKAFNLFKVRAAWGLSGQPPGTTAADPLRWSTARSGVGVGYVVGSIGNPDVELESVSEIELGLEFEIDNSYGMDFTYYMGSATNSIVSFPNSPSTGLTATGVPRNVGGINNWGFEMNAYANIFRTEEYGLDLNFILNHQNNEVTDLGGAQPIGSSYGDQFIRVGSPRSSWFNFRNLGPGFDANGVFTGAQYSDSLEFLATAVPTWTGSFGLTFRFLKHFTLYGLVEWAGGMSVLNLSREFQVSFQNDVEYKNAEAVVGAPDADVNSQEYKDAAATLARLDNTFSTNFINSADWVRFRELSLRINATDWLNDLFGGNSLQGVNAVLSVRNVALFTSYDGVDPEGNADGGQSSGVDRGVEFNTLPQPRVVNFQLNFSF